MLHSYWGTLSTGEPVEIRLYLSSLIDVTLTATPGTAPLGAPATIANFWRPVDIDVTVETPLAPLLPPVTTTLAAVSVFDPPDWRAQLRSALSTVLVTAGHTRADADDLLQAQYPLPAFDRHLPALLGTRATLTVRTTPTRIYTFYVAATISEVLNPTAPLHLWHRLAALTLRLADPPSSTTVTILSAIHLGEVDPRSATTQASADARRGTVVPASSPSTSVPPPPLSSTVATGPLPAGGSSGFAWYVERDGRRQYLPFIPGWAEAGGQVEAAFVAGGVVRTGGDRWVIGGTADAGLVESSMVRAPDDSVVMIFAHRSRSADGRYGVAGADGRLPDAVYSDLVAMIRQESLLAAQLTGQRPKPVVFVSCDFATPVEGQFATPVAGGSRWCR